MTYPAVGVLHRLKVTDLSDAGRMDVLKTNLDQAGGFVGMIAVVLLQVTLRLPLTPRSCRGVLRHRGGPVRASARDLGVVLLSRRATSDHRTQTRRFVRARDAGRGGSAERWWPDARLSRSPGAAAIDSRLQRPKEAPQRQYIASSASARTLCLPVDDVFESEDMSSSAASGCGTGVLARRRSREVASPSSQRAGIARHSGISSPVAHRFRRRYRNGCVQPAAVMLLRLRPARCDPACRRAACRYDRSADLTRRRIENSSTWMAPPSTAPYRPDSQLYACTERGRYF